MAGDEFMHGARAGWTKYAQNPVLGGSMGTCFDICVLREESGYRMYFSWRPRHAVAVVCSSDGLHWGEPKICIEPRDTGPGWEDELNRPAVVKREGVYHMWYTGQYKPGIADGTSHIFHGISTDGINFARTGDRPVLAPEAPWEKAAVMCPDVIWDETAGKYRMWYSAGEQYEPTAIGYAESTDGLHWVKYPHNPVFQADPENCWEGHKAAGCHVQKRKDWYYMFYIGYHNEDYAQIGIARSRDGLSGWERHPQNPILAPDPGEFDGEACYKPYALYDGQQWILWYNGRKGTLEQIGAAIHPGEDLGFPEERKAGDDV